MLNDILLVLDFKGVAELLFDIEGDLVFKGVAVSEGLIVGLRDIKAVLELEVECVLDLVFIGVLELDVETELLCDGEAVELIE